MGGATGRFLLLFPPEAASHRALKRVGDAVLSTGF